MLPEQMLTYAVSFVGQEIQDHEQNADAKAPSASWPGWWVREMGCIGDCPVGSWHCCITEKKLICVLSVIC
jgi:hypothetical protein